METPLASGMELRTKVLEFSLDLEHRLGQILSALFKLKDNPRTFGDTSAAISFQTRVEFLKDLELLDKEQAKDLEIFMAIRNKLVHNIEIDTLTKAINSLKNTVTVSKMLSYNEEMKALYYEVGEEGKERALHICLLALYPKIGKTLCGVLDKITEDIKETTKFYESSNKLLKEFNSGSVLLRAATATWMMIEEEEPTKAARWKKYFYKELEKTFKDKCPGEDYDEWLTSTGFKV